MRDPVMRIRCPKDTDPTNNPAHLALDVRMPLDIDVLGALVHRIRPWKCPCGARMILRTIPDEEVPRG